MTPRPAWLRRWRGPRAWYRRGTCARPNGNARWRVSLGREMTRTAPWSTESVPLRQVRHWSRPPQSSPVPYPGPCVARPWVSIARWWAMIQGSSAGVADVRDRPPVQLRPLWPSGGNLPPRRPRQPLRRSGLRPGRTAGVAARGRGARSTPPPRPHEPRPTSATLSGPTAESDASGFTRPGPRCFTAPRVACLGTTPERACFRACP